MRGAAPQVRTLYFEHESNRAILQDRWKLVALKQQDWELYDIQRDRTELANLASTHPKLVRRLAAQWDTWAAANSVTPLPRDYGVKYLKALD